MYTEVRSFSGEHRFLSNFYTSRVCYLSEVYSTVDWDRLMALKDQLAAENRRLLDDAGMACECPPENCGCAGCSYARERAEEGTL